MKKILLFFFFLVTGSTFLLAESKRFFINKFDIKDGMASNQVLTAHQDRFGFLWIGTANGLQRFDGRKFMNYTIKSPDSQPSKPVWDILEDKNGQLWLRVGEDYGRYTPDKELFTPFAFEKNENRFRGEKLWMDSRGNLYVIIVDNKLLWIDQDRGIITDKNVPIQIPEGWRPNSIFEDKEGLFWISCIEGIAVFDPKYSAIYHKNHNPFNLKLLNFPDSGSVTNIYQDKKQVFWVNYWAPDEILRSFNPQTNSWEDHMPDLKIPNGNYQEAFGMIELPDGQLWRYGLQVLADFDRGKGKLIPLVQSDLKYDKISKAIWDPSGGLWLATDQGLYFLHFDTPSIFFIELDASGGNHELQDIEEVIYQGDTSLWLGSWGRGLKIYSRSQGELNSDWTRMGSPKTKEALQIWAIHHDHQRDWVFIGMQKGLLQVIDLKTKNVTYLNPEAFEGSTIRTIAQDKIGTDWFGTQSGGLFTFSGPDLNEEYFRSIRKFSSNIPQLLVDQDQDVWVATYSDGVYIIDHQDGKILSHLDHTIISSNKIEVIHQLNDSIVLLGSELLNTYNKKTGENHKFSYSDGMVSNGINHIESDGSGLAWINTPNGLTRFDPQTHTFSSFGKNHFFSKLPNNGYSGTRLSDGQLVFISNNSLLIFDPNQFNRNLEPLTPVITNVELYGRYVGDGVRSHPQQTFQSHENSLSFDFSLLNFPIQDRFSYYYRLVGADPNWIQTRGDFKANYSLLPPGKYQFEVKSANELGEFSKAALYPFEIKPAMIQTWWFKALLALLFLSIIGLIYRMHVHRILAVVNLRSRLARDLHDDMGSTLSTINILSSMAKTKLGTDPAKTSEYISKISENSQRMMESMDDIVWSIKPQNDSIEKLIARMREFASQALESKDILFSMDIDPKVIGMKLSMDARRDLFLIFKEGINNAAKYSGASRVFISFDLQNTQFIMKIQDFGKGFDFHTLEDGNGLGNMHKRATNLHGRLEVKSQVGEGTELILKVSL